MIFKAFLFFSIVTLLGCSSVSQKVATDDHEGPQGCTPNGPPKYPPIYYLGTIYLTAASPSLDESTKNELLKTKDFLKNEPNAAFQIEGHVAPFGDEKAEIKMAQRIADSAKQFLLSHGVPPKNLTNTISYGSEKPVNFSWPKNKKARIERLLVIY